MDITPLVDQVMTALLPALAEAVGEELGKKIVSTSSRLYKLLQERFKRPSKAKQALDGLKAAPQDPAAQALFRQQLAVVLQRDHDFRRHVEEIIGSVSQASSDTAVAGPNSTINQSKTQNFGSTIINLPQIPAEVKGAISFVLNVQGEGAGTIGHVLAELPPLRSTLPSVSRDAQGRDVYAALNQLLGEYGPDIEADLALIAKVLHPVVAAERAEISYRPGRFLRNLVTQVGAGLAEIDIFTSTQYAKIDDWHSVEFPVDKDGYRERLNTSEVPLPTLAESFELVSKGLLLVQETVWYEKDQGSVQEVGTLKRLLRPRPADKRSQGKSITYSLEYDRKPVLPNTDEYHLIFSKNVERREAEVQARLGWLNDTQKPQKPRIIKPIDDVVLVLSAEVLAKFIRAILHDYLIYMRPQATMSRLLEALLPASSTDEAA